MSATVKGTVLQARKAFVGERFGDAALEKVLASLSADDQKILRGIILPLGWYPADTCNHFDEAIINSIGGDARKAFWELGRQSAEHNLGKFQAAYLRGKNPLTFLAQTPAIYRLYYEVGSREFQPTGEKSGVMITSGAEGVTVGDCLTVMGWHERALEMVGARNLKITHPICRASKGDVCRYEISWS